MAQARFEAAAALTKTFTTRPSNDELLTLYGLYKQATVGDNETGKPWAVQMEAKAKWEAWTANKGKSSETAMTEYADFVEGIKDKYL